MTESDDLGAVFRALSHPYRRQLLVALMEENPQDDDDVDPLDQVPADDLSTAEVSLVHNHLPQLEDRGFIEWDRGTGEISKGPNWDDIAPLLRLIQDHRDELPDGWL